MSRFLRTLILTALTGACVQDAYDDAKALSVAEASSGSSSSTGGPTTGDDAPPGPIQTVTGEPSPTSTSTSPPDESTGAVPAEPAKILDVSLDPQPLELPGAIAVDVATEYATGVTMQLENAPPIPLAAGPQRHFVGAIEVLSGLFNGTYSATFVPYADQLAGEPVVADYTVALPDPGTESLWDSGFDAKLGQIEALVVTPDAHVVAFGTRFENDVPHCFLHRRDLAGQYTADDFIAIFPEHTCMATDLVVDGESLYLLATVIGGNDPRWRLVTLPSWDAPPAIVRTGKLGEVAHALARGPDGVVACGTGPTLLNDRDARVWGAGFALEFDYAPVVMGMKKEHEFDETVTDCAYAGDRLVMVGEASGKHVIKDQQDPIKRKRLFVLERGQDKTAAWTVAGPGPGNFTQSGGTAVAIDDNGRSIVGLYTCEDACDRFGELRVYEPGGKLAEQIPLASEISPPFDVALSPAGYIVMASTEIQDFMSSRFLVQAYWPDEFEPAWNYSQAELSAQHLAFALTIGPGVVLAGGVNGEGHPTIAYIHP